MDTIQLIVSVLQTDDDVVTTNLSFDLVDALTGLGFSTVRQPVSGTNVPGSKGDPITLAAFIVALSVAAVPALIAFVQHWAVDRRRVTIEAPNGAKLEFTANRDYSEGELLEFVSRLNDLSENGDSPISV